MNQKVDVKALPKPEPQEHKAEAHVAPLNKLEQQISNIIKESVGIGGFGLTDPLYYSGLSSLGALRLATELYKRFGLEPDMNSFAKTASLQSIENDILDILLSGDSCHSERSEESNGEDQPQELTFQQTGLYLDCVRNPSSTAYNLPFILTFPEGTLAGEVKKALLDVLEARDGKVYLVPARAEEEIPSVKLGSEEEYEALKEAFMQPFDLSGPLYRLTLVQTPGKLRLMGDFHHLIFDGHSYDLFLGQLTAALEGKAPEKEDYTYFSYARDQKAYQESAAFQEAEPSLPRKSPARRTKPALYRTKRPWKTRLATKSGSAKRLGPMSWPAAMNWASPRPATSWARPMSR